MTIGMYMEMEMDMDKDKDMDMDTETDMGMDTGTDTDMDTDMDMDMEFRCIPWNFAKFRDSEDYFRKNSFSRVYKNPPPWAAYSNMPTGGCCEKYVLVQVGPLPTDCLCCAYHQTAKIFHPPGTYAQSTPVR
jgi:hypothetical protein